MSDEKSDIDELIESVEKWVENIDRASLVQDRSVGIIKQACRLAAKELRAAVEKFNKADAR